MSLAINAAPFESNVSNKNYKSKINNTKISSVLNKIHDNIDDNNSLDDFEPLPQALSAGVEKTKSNFKKLSRLSHLKSKQRILEFCR